MVNPTLRGGCRPTTRSRWSSIHNLWLMLWRTGCHPIALSLSPVTPSPIRSSLITPPRSTTELALGAPNGVLYAETLTVGLVLHLLANHGVAKPKVPSPRGKLNSFQLRSVLECIASQLEDDVSLMTLAQRARISPFHFARLFRATVGVPPHQFVSRLRLEKAVGLMKAGKLTLAQIAVECGFHDQPHFTRAFHSVFRTTPAMYLRRC